MPLPRFQLANSVLASLFVCIEAAAFSVSAVELKNAIVVAPARSSESEKKAIQMLIEEAAKRSGIMWAVTNAMPPPGVPAIVTGTMVNIRDLVSDFEAEFGNWTDASKPEGFRIAIVQKDGRPMVMVVGNDSRGLLFGIGRLLRELRMQQGSASLVDKVHIATTPKYPLRGHQLGYRPKCNSYDAWDLPVWEQYFRDLVVFGCNAIELIPPRSDDAATSPHFPRPPTEMMIGMSKLANAYGLDVWVWYPAMDKDYSNPKTVDSALEEWASVFSKLPRLDAVFVPGGDPGHTQPKFLMALLEKQAANLHRYHPKAEMWVSPQGFTQTWMNEFLEILTSERPTWLNGVVFGPQVRVALPRLRELVPAQYPIRHYPDITHSRQCQYPVPDWDVAYAVTEGRECINPRPLDEAAIFRKTQPYTIGFLTYSEGCNDDVNKIIWSALGWDPQAEVKDILREYSRYFIGERYFESFADGLLALERNWRGSLPANDGVEKTLVQFQKLEKEASPADLRNWRFQQALFRAYYDASVRRRLMVEMQAERNAMKALSAGRDSMSAIAEAEQLLAQATDKPENTRIFTLAEALFQSIGMQLSVEKYKAIAVDRGASLDTLNYPLNNRVWLRQQFKKIRGLPTENQKRKAIDEIINWTNPGAASFYDDLGNPAAQPHLVRGSGFNEDPGSMVSPRVDFEEDLVFDEPLETAGVPRRISWMDHVESLYDAPLRMRYTGLDPHARYRLRVVYGGDNFKRKIRLVANEKIEIHPLMAKPYPLKPIEFPIPEEATKTGELNLSWFGEPGLGGNGRNCQVSEVWLIKERFAAKH
jgi:hypothetical protein